MRQAWFMPITLRNRRPRHIIAGMSVLAGAVLALSGCISIPVGEAPVGPTTTPDTSYMGRLKAASVVKPTDNTNKDEPPQFVTDSRNIGCIFTSMRKGHLNTTWEPSNYGDNSNNASPIIPVVSCQMASYPPPAANPKNVCTGSYAGFLGGTALLQPKSVSYGGCRAGVTAVEAAFGTEGTVNEVMGKIPVVTEGSAVESGGYRCAPMDDGVACANMASGLGFFISREKYQFFGPGYEEIKPSSAASTTVPAATTAAP